MDGLLANLTFLIQLIFHFEIFCRKKKVSIQDEVSHCNRNYPRPHKGRHLGCQIVGLIKGHWVLLSPPKIVDDLAMLGKIGIDPACFSRPLRSVTSLTPSAFVCETSNFVSRSTPKTTQKLPKNPPKNVWRQRFHRKLHMRLFSKTRRHFPKDRNLESRVDFVMNAV